MKIFSHHKILKTIILTIVAFSAIQLSAKEFSNINAGWKFNKSDVPNSQLISFVDTSWENVNLPHTWNAFDGQDGGNNYYRGICWYRKHITIPASYSGKIIYLKIGAANLISSIYINGIHIGDHKGGYTAFMFDITQNVLLGRENIIAVKVNNSKDIICPPMDADFTFDGGITRNVELITANQAHINPNEVILNNFTVDAVSIAQSGIILKQSNVSESSANLKLIAKIKNSSLTDETFILEYKLKNAAGDIIKTMSDSKSIPANDTITSIIETTVTSPHLWDGLNDPYLYKVEVNLKVNGVIVDNSLQPLGFRYFSIDPDKGFFLNGKSYPLRGISFHDSKINKGHAVSDFDRKETIDLLRETGCNYFRLAHYPHGDFTYNYLDSLGIICWTEIPVINKEGINSDENKIYTKSAVSQMYELIRQQYNHPCVLFWGLCNEVNARATFSPFNTVSILNQVVKSEDNYRLTTLAADQINHKTNFIPDLFSTNRYDGWYTNTISGFATIMDDLHARNPTSKIGVSEYGCGGNPLQHEYPTSQPATSNGPWHPEEYQNLFHETYLSAIKTRPYFWSTSIWVGIDFPSDGRAEGSHPGINDKGLINFDRTIKKDIFYLYKANWNKKDKFVYITSRRYVKRVGLSNTVRIYSNCKSVKLNVNGKLLPALTSSDHIFLWDNVQMKRGNNHIIAIGSINKIEYHDSVDWSCVDEATVPDSRMVP